jgi:prevent-host-death family protein
MAGPESQAERGRIGVTDLRRRLAEVLLDVQRGASVVVTDRGAPIARIRPVRFAPELEPLLDAGIVTWSGRRARAPRTPVRPKRGSPLSDLVSG